MKKSVTNGKNRVDDLGRAYAGSQLQIQLYVSRREHELTASVATALHNAGCYLENIRWKSPLEQDNFAEFKDGVFLDQLELSRLRSELSAFWPSGGPNWDGLAVFTPGPGVLLIEAKSYPEEMFGSGCKASLPSRKRIEKSIEKTKRWLGIDDNVDWLGPLYQYANRLAHIYFIRELGQVDAWLVNLCFIEDPHKPTLLEGWQKELPIIKNQLGFSGRKIPYTVDVFLPAHPRTELVK